MSLTKYESSIKTIPSKCDIVYERLADLRNLAKVRDFLSDTERRTALAAQIPVEKLRQMEDTFKSMTFDTDSVSISVPMAGNITLFITEREAPKLIKFTAKGIPVAANLWIQLLPLGDEACKLKVTAGAELNFFIKSMVDKYAPIAVERLSEMLASLPYDNL